MATEVQNHSEQSVTSLVSGILSDAQDLFKQQFRLAREEIATDLRKTREAVASFVIGATIGVVGLFALCLSLAQLIHWLAAPSGTDPSVLPLWVCYLISGGLFLLTGVICIFAGKQKIQDVGTPLHETAQALKENLEWKTTIKRS